MEINQRPTDLGSLADPTAIEFSQALKIDGFNERELFQFYEMMKRIRMVEEAVASLELSGESKCPCHLGIGQEAVAVGVAHALTKDDRAFGAHRSHSHFLAMGGTSESIICEILGKVSGCSKGMGGSMHLYGEEFGFYGSVPIVAGTISLALGAALAAKMDGKGSIAIAYFGDGASEEGVLHECLNLSAQYQLPILFVCENNLYASHLDIAQRQPSDSIARFAVAHHVDSIIVDGNDVVSVARNTTDLVSKMRKGGGPAFIEAVTYRWRGHVGADENIDVGLRRSAEDIVAWKNRDPIRRLQEGIDDGYTQCSLKISDIDKMLEKEIEEALWQARNAAYPDESQSLATVYANPVVL